MRAPVIVLALLVTSCGGKHAAAPAAPLGDPVSETIGGITLNLDAAAVERVLGPRPRRAR